MSETAVKTLYRADGKRRVLVVHRSDGCFALVEQYWYQNVYEGKTITEGWASLDSPASLFATAEIAEREAKIHYSWLR